MTNRFPNLLDMDSTWIYQLKNSYTIRNVSYGLRVILAERLSAFSLFYLVALVIIAIIGPHVTPYHYSETIYHNGELARTLPPSLMHPLGTTNSGNDVLSRIIYGTRPTVITGAVGGTLIISIGLLIGVTAGYMGGRVENILMRFTDFMYAVPLIPFAIVLLAFVGFGFWTTIVIIGVILWRSSARILRSQVLQIKERPYVLAARATGAGRFRIVFKHILPNIASMAILFFALGVGYSILTQASLAFIGVSDPFVPSWGVMIRNAYRSGVMTEAWWWILPPGILLSLTVMTTFIIGRRFEAEEEINAQ